MHQAVIKIKPRQAVGYAAIVSLGLLTFALLLPSIYSTSSALSCLDGDTTGCTVAMAETEAEVKVKTSITVAMSSKVAMEVIPTSTGSSTIGSTNLAVSTNSVDGYALYMQASDGLTNTSTVHDNKVNVEKISIIDSPTTINNMPNNHYGYYLGENVADSNTTFNTLPIVSSVIKRTTNMTSGSPDLNYGYGDTYTLSFGVKIGTELPSGTYSGTVMVSAVANPETVRSMSDLDYMQDMTSDICSRTREGYTKQLIDTRDGKSYWVAKLKDGNCWMTQNLAYTITQEMIDNGSINSTNTDINFTWGNTPAWTDVESWKALGEEYTEENYPGEYVGPRRTYENLSGDLSDLSEISTYSWSLGNILQLWPDYMVKCFSYCNGPFINVSDTEWKPTFKAMRGIYAPSDGDSREGLITADIEKKLYDAHYLVGTNYQYNTVTAGTSNSNDVEAPGSICPRGWKLTAAGALAYLFGRYGLSGNVISNTDYSLIGMPFYIPRSGYVYVNTTEKKAGMNLAGNNGYMLGLLYGLDYNTSANFNARLGRTSGFATRCLAR